MKKLYHYCSNQKCFSILKGKSIRMSDIQKSNDYKELSLFFPEIFDKVEELYKQKPFKFKYSGKTGEEALQQLLDESYDYWRFLFQTGKFSNYVLCFSEVADDLGQWRGYADNGKGCCLGFSFDEIQNYCNMSNGVLRFEQVIYLVEEGVEKVMRDTAKKILLELKGLRKWIVSEITLDDNCEDTDELMHFNFDGMLEYAFTDSLKYKSHAFHDENEWRLFLAAPPRKDSERLALWQDRADEKSTLGIETLRFLSNKLDFHATETDLVSFCAIPFTDLSQNPIKTLWIGPKNETRESDINLYLKMKGYDDTEVRFSSITYH